MKLLSKLAQNREYLFLLATSFFFFLLRFPSLFEPNWYGDEGVYQVVGMGINNGRLLYRDIWDNKPPLLYVLYALFGSDQFMLRLLSLLGGIVAVFAFFLLAKNLFVQRKVAFLTTGLFAFLFSLPLLEGNIANAENFMIPLIIFSALIIVRYIQSHNSRSLFLAGFFLSLAFLLKIVAIFDFVAFFHFLLLVSLPKEKFKELIKIKHLLPVIKKLFPFFVSFLLPILFVFFFFFLKGALPIMLKATFVQNVGYVGYGNTLFIKQGFLLVKLALLAGVVSYVFIKRNTLSTATVFIVLWTIFSLFNAFFSQRPYTHYLLALLPSTILFAGTILHDFYAKKSIIRTKTQRLSLFVFILFLIIIIKSFNLYTKTPAYYGNFISFMFHTKDITSYQAFFDANTPVDYELATFLNTHASKTATLFIWGNNAQVYKLVNKLPPGRFTVAYHMTTNAESINESKSVFENTKPTFIIVTSPTNPIPFSLIHYKQRLTIVNATIYEYIY